MSGHWGQHRVASLELNLQAIYIIYLYVYLLYLYMWKNYIFVLVLIFHNFTWALSKFMKNHLWLIWNILTENIQIYPKINQQGFCTEWNVNIKITFFSTPKWFSRILSLYILSNTLSHSLFIIIEAGKLAATMQCWFLHLHCLYLHIHFLHKYYKF